MWKKLFDTSYYLLVTNNLEVFLTDYIRIWSTKYTDSSFLTCLKNSNEDLEIDDKAFMEKGMRILMNPEGLGGKVRVKEENRSLRVFLTISLGFPFRIEMILGEGSRELFFQKVTLCLLKTVHNLHASEQELQQLLQKKDKEIEEYKCVGGEIALRHLKTIPFNNEAHMVKYNAYRENFGAIDIPESLLNKIVEIPEVKEEVTELNTSVPTITIEPAAQATKEEIKLVPQSIKSEPQSIKTEPHSQSQSYRPLVSPNKRLKRKLNL